MIRGDTMYLGDGNGVGWRIDTDKGTVTIIQRERMGYESTMSIGRTVAEIEIPLRLWPNFVEYVNDDVEYLTS